MNSHYKGAAWLTICDSHWIEWR